MSLTLISFSADWCWPWPPLGASDVMGISRPRLACTSAGVRPIAVAAWTAAAIAPHPMPSRKSVQKTLALIGSRESRMPSMTMLLLVADRASEIHVHLELHLVTGVRAVQERRVRLAVGEHAARGVVEPVLELHIDPIDRHLAPGEEDAGGLEVRDQA